MLRHFCKCKIVRSSFTGKFQTLRLGVFNHVKSAFLLDIWQKCSLGLGHKPLFAISCTVLNTSICHIASFVSSSRWESINSPDIRAFLNTVWSKIGSPSLENAIAPALFRFLKCVNSVESRFLLPLQQDKHQYQDFWMFFG